MEFVGDAVITLVVRELVYKKYPHSSEGDLTKMVSQVVSNKNLAKFSKVRNRSTKQKADLFELKVGQMYFKDGYEATKTWLIDIMGLNRISDFRTIQIDYKSVLQDLSWYVNKIMPEYNRTELGDKTKPMWEIECICLGEVIKVKGFTVKATHQKAAKKVLAAVKIKYQSIYPKLYKDLNL